MNFTSFNIKRFIISALLVSVQLSLSLFFVLKDIHASEITERIAKDLVDHGFENVRVISHNNDIFVCFEDNLYRTKVDGIVKALDIITDLTSSKNKLHVYILQHSMPRVLILTPRDIWYGHRHSTIDQKLVEHNLDVSYDLSNSWQLLKNIKSGNPHTFKSDIIVYPQFKARNIRLDQLYEIQLNVAPALEFSLWQGMKFTGQFIFPIVNEHGDYYGEGDLARPGFVTLSQSFRLPGNIFAEAAIGNFNAHRYGGDIKLLYPLNDLWDIELQTGLTGESWFSKNTWHTTPINTVTWFFKTQHFQPTYNLRFDFGFGKFIHGDTGIRADISRYFGETVIGFYAIRSDGEINGGFHFAIPLPSSNRGKTASLRVRPPKYFDWEYNAGSEFTLGRYYETRPNENRYEHYWNVAFIKQQLLQLKPPTQ